jgi:hypothetical protein
MSQEGKSEITQDSLVERLVADPGNPETKLLSGYLGKSDRDGVWRIYLNLEFNEYLEIAEGDILHVEKLGREGESQAGAWMWVTPGAAVEHVRPERRRAQGEFLAGDITALFLRRSAAGRFGMPAPIMSLPRTFSVTECATCPTDDGSHTCVPAVCTLATSCLTTVPTDPGCGDRFIIG